MQGFHTVWCICSVNEVHCLAAVWTVFHKMQSRMWSISLKHKVPLPPDEGGVDSVSKSLHHQKLGARLFLCEMPVCHKSSQPVIVSYWMNKENNKQWKCGVCYFSDRCDGCVDDWDKSMWFHTQIHPSLIQTLCVEVGTKTSESRLHYTTTSLRACFTPCGFIFYECLIIILMWWSFKMTTTNTNGPSTSWVRYIQINNTLQIKLPRAAGKSLIV